MTTAQQTTSNDVTRSHPTWVETLGVWGEGMWDKVKELMHEGNVRRIAVRNQDDHAIIEIPVTDGVVAAIAATVLVAVAAFGELAQQLGHRGRPRAGRNAEDQQR